MLKTKLIVIVRIKYYECERFHKQLIVSNDSRRFTFFLNSSKIKHFIQHKNLQINMKEIKKKFLIQNIFLYKKCYTELN